MVRKYIRKSQRKAWSEDGMRMAIEAVIKQGCSIRKASLDYQVPQATLSRKIHQCRADPEKETALIANPKCISVQTIFTKDQEKHLCEYINILENSNISLSGIDIRRLAYQVAETFKIPHRFNKDIASAGEDWYHGFLKRNPQVTQKKNDNSFEKNIAFSKEKVHKFFDLLQNIINKHQLEASDIYSLDETVILCSSKTGSEEESISKSIGSSNAVNEQSLLVTAEICFSASGVYLPLMLIFPCQTKSKLLLKGAPSGAWAAFDITGQMKLDIFLIWLKKFVEFSKASKDSPVLLVVDGYHTFLKNLLVLEYTKENGVHFICLPSKCSDKLHPMHYNFMKMLSVAYTSEVMKWLTDSPGSSVTVNEVYQLFGKAYMKVSMSHIPIISFRNTGIWPIDKDLFAEDFTSPTEDTSMYTQSSSELLKSVPHEACQEIILNTASGSVGGHEQLYTQQSFIQQFVQQQYKNPKQNVEEMIQVENVPLNKTTNNVVIKEDTCSAIIPREAHLSEIQVQDIQNLMQCQRKLYFYVSPYRLNLQC